MNNEVDFIINGEIYLKRGPEIGDSSNTIKKLDDMIYGLELLRTKEKDSEKIDDFLTQAKNLKDYAESVDGKISFAGTNSFFKAFTTDGINIELRECNIASKKSRLYNSLEELNNDFIKLSDFLNKATFVGRKFRRTKPLGANFGKTDRSFMNTSLDEHIVLYATQDLFLAKEINYSGDDAYTLIYSRYTLDGNYVFYGPVYSEYKDTQKVYSEIMEQLSSYDKGRSK